MASSALIPLVAAAVFGGVTLMLNESKNQNMTNLINENVKEIGKFEQSLTDNLKFVASKIEGTHDRSGVQVS